MLRVAMGSNTGSSISGYCHPGKPSNYKAFRSVGSKGSSYRCVYAHGKRIVEAVGPTGAIRVSPLHCHTVADIETYLRVTQELAQTFAK